MLYYTEESDAIDMTSKAAVADERAKGKKKREVKIACRVSLMILAKTYTTF